MSALIIDFGWILNKEVRKSLPYSKTVKSILSFFSIRLLIQELLVLYLTPILFAKLDLSCGRCAYVIRKFYFIKISLL